MECMEMNYELEAAEDHHCWRDIVVDNLKKRLSDPLESKSFKADLKAYLLALEENILEGHENRYVVVNEGHIFPETFGSERDAVEDPRFTDLQLTLFQVPGKCFSDRL